MRKYRRITYEDRCQIYALSKRGASQESIAGVLGVSQTTVSREMCRNRGQRGYRFKQAEAKAQARQAIRSRPRKLTARPFTCRGPVWEFRDRVHFTTARSRRSVQNWFSRSCLIDYCAMPPYDLPTPSTACDRAFMSPRSKLDKSHPSPARPR